MINTHCKTEKPASNKHLTPIEEEKMYLQSLKVQAGWIMMEQLLSFDIHWVGSKLKTLFGLWQQQFTYEFEDWNLDNQIYNLRISVPCLKTLRSFLRKCKTLQTEHVLKLVGTYLMNFFNAFLTENEKDKWKSANERLMNDHNLAKIVKIFKKFLMKFIFDRNFSGVFVLFHQDFTSKNSIFWFKM